MENGMAGKGDTVKERGWSFVHMTVVEVDDDGRAECSWFDMDGALRRGTFEVPELLVVEPA